jgi:hypothetical protein
MAVVDALYQAAETKTVVKVEKTQQRDNRD